MADDHYEVLHGLLKEPILGPLKFKMAGGRHIENRLWPSHCRISVKFCAGKQFSQNLGNWTDSRVTWEHISCFPNAIWALASASGLFLSSPIHLFLL